jgi:hypothetical protein
VPAIVDHPDLVHQIVAASGDLVANQPERRHVAAYLTGLSVAKRKTVSGIPRAVAVITDQACLKRWLTAVAWDVARRNARRWELRQGDSSTRWRPWGRIPLDNPLFDHDGKLLDAVGSFWDHADQRQLIAHDELIITSVCRCGKRDPLAFRRFRKRETREAEARPFAAQPDLGQQLVLLRSFMVQWRLWMPPLSREPALTRCRNRQATWRRLRHASVVTCLRSHRCSGWSNPGGTNEVVSGRRISRSGTAQRRRAAPERGGSEARPLRSNSLRGTPD